jgi:hypothetical protein
MISDIMKTIYGEHLQSPYACRVHVSGSSRNAVLFFLINNVIYCLILVNITTCMCVCVCVFVCSLVTRLPGCRFRVAVGLERGPLILVRITEELLELKK